MAVRTGLPLVAGCASSLFFLVGGLGAAGCGTVAIGRPTVAGGPAVGLPPADAATSVTVWVPASDAAPQANVPSPGWLRARYVLEPDGVLRAGFGDAATPDAHPPIARTLTPHEARQVHELARAAARAPIAQPVTGPRVFTPAGPNPACLVYVSTERTRAYTVTIRRTIPAAETSAARPTDADALVALLAELTWR